MLLNDLNRQGTLDVRTTNLICVYTKDIDSYSNCWDRNRDKNLEIDDIDESYGLYIEEFNDRINVYIPKGVKCKLKKTSANADCTIVYKNIECDLIFENEPIDLYCTLDEN